MTEGHDTKKTPQLNPRALRFDWLDWLPYLAESDLPDDKKREFLETVWAIVIGFVDLGYGLNPAQEICGEVIDLKAVLVSAVISSENTDRSGEEGAA